MAWTADTHIDRHDDAVAALDYVRSESIVAAAIDPDRVALVGHSLGGYTSIGLLGGWPEWHEPGFTAALLLSPYLNPYIVQGSLPSIEAPLMYQSGTADLGVLPFLQGRNGRTRPAATTRASPSA